ncbi:amino acid permease [Sphingopyxis sp. JAI128]|uniref:amino acid permease n=1 Tax=Sphingopyxis sp. JAI128 TaxID=2723066 RepID=UPI0016148BBF|nr:amino acid permease [Sphingopyxis sp. JAI128]MBB6427742.1 APA family basic amino acid/polyamine antiporter [Sphingopyxis sp. JAI128]
MTDSLLRRKDIVPKQAEGQGLARTLSWPHLVALGVGAIVGTGILTLIGVGAAKAGPAVILSFAIAGLICICAALAYAEMATMIPASGSAYTYSYVVIGELVAWVIGWSLILEYSLVVSTVAVGWSGYASPLLKSWMSFPDWLTHAPVLAGHLSDGTLAVARAGINLPAVFIIFVVAGLLIAGTRESATLNATLVLVKIAALIVFVVVALPHFDAANLDPFMPNGFPKSGLPGQEVGVMAAAAIIFFAFYGFDAIATAAEETKNPGRDLSIGIVGSMLICVLIYVAVGVTAVGALNYTRLAGSDEPLAFILREIGQPGAARYLGLSAVIALPTVILAFFYGQSRIFFTMARDGMLPARLAKLSQRGAPTRITLFTAIVVSVLAACIPLDELAALANAGTLAAFTAVTVCMLIMRQRAPDAPRTFRAPLPWLIGVVAIGGCLYLFYSLPAKTQLWFGIWNLAGLAVYFLYARRNAIVA